MPRAPNPNRVVSSTDHTSGDSTAMPNVGAIELPESEIMTGEAVAAAGVGNDYLKQLAFMEEKITVIVNESSNPNDDPLPMVGVNGTNQFFVRGEPTLVKRKFVEVLARAKTEAVTTKVDERNSENPTNRILRNRAHKYPFQVVEDRNSRGRDWLTAILREDQLKAA